MKKFLLTLLLLVAWTHSVLAYPHVYYRDDTPQSSGYRHIVEDRLFIDSVHTYVGASGKNYIFFKTMRNILWDEPTMTSYGPWAISHEKNENPEYWLYDAYSGAVHKVAYNLTVNNANVDEIFNNEKYSKNQGGNKAQLLRKALNDIAKGSKDYNDPKHVELIRNVIKESGNGNTGGLIDIYSNGPLPKINETTDTDIIQVVNDPNPCYRGSGVTYSIYNLYQQRYSEVEAALAQYGWNRMPGHWYWTVNVLHLSANDRTILYERTSPFDENVNELLYVQYYYDQDKPTLPPNQTACGFELYLVPEDGSQETIDMLYDQFYDRIKNACPTRFVFDFDEYEDYTVFYCGFDDDNDGHAGPRWGATDQLNYIYLEKRNDCVVIHTIVDPYMTWNDDSGRPSPMAGPEDRAHPVLETYLEADRVSSGGVTLRTWGELYSKNDYPFYAHKVGREEVENGIPVD